ncbi:hypothetical protein [Pseudomonas sp. PMCC200344]|uniref:hypothetical protein n=1 Tax=Pseudomonas sp. PMCC200344 TaxID=3042028 RepID=UPI0024B3884E|nr:hypothetical protein [Pseudomonas sp. PMCC200344]
MAIKLEIHATDPEVISLVQRYWAMNEEGDFLEKVGALLPFREVKNAAGIASFVKTQCLVIDQNQSCSICGGAVAITTRSQVNKDPQHSSSSPCPSCKAVQDDERRVAEAEANAKLQSYLAKHIERVDALTTRYDEIPDDLSLIALALDRAVASGLVGRSFSYRESRSLAPMGAEDFVDRLWSAQVLTDAPRATGASAYSANDNGLSYYKDRIKLALVPDEKLGAGVEAFQKIAARSFDDKPRLLNLWFDYAVAECMSYLYEQSHKEKLDVPRNQVEEIKNAIRTAVQFYSISQVWCLLWKAVKEVSGQAEDRNYKRDDAGTTISQRLLHHYEKTRKGNKEAKRWGRIEFLSAGTLGKIFKERFGIDHDSSGVAVARLFSEGPSVREEIEASIDAKVKQLMACALAAGSGAAAIYDFAELIRNGAATSEAVELIAKIYAFSPTNEVSVT